jgi:hypothetical protein
VQSFSVGELRGTAEEEPLLTEADLGGGQGLASPETRLLGFYSLAGIELALERLGHLDRLRELGFENPEVEFDLGASGQTLRIFGSRGPARAGARAAPAPRPPDDPRRGAAGGRLAAAAESARPLHTDPARPARPGASRPRHAPRDDGRADAHLRPPAALGNHRHSLRTSTPWRRRADQMRFLDPRAKACTAASRRRSRPLPLGEATHAASDGRLRDAATGEAIRWPPAAMILPVTAQRCETALESPEYERAAAEAEIELRLDSGQRGARSGGSAVELPGPAAEEVAP